VSSTPHHIRQSFKETEVENEYSIRIYTGGFAGVKTAMNEPRKKRPVSRRIEVLSYKILDASVFGYPFLRGIHSEVSTLISHDTEQV